MSNMVISYYEPCPFIISYILCQNTKTYYDLCKTKKLIKLHPSKRSKALRGGLNMISSNFGVPGTSLV